MQKTARAFLFYTLLRFSHKNKSPPTVCPSATSHFHQLRTFSISSLLLYEAGYGLKAMHNASDRSVGYIVGLILLIWLITARDNVYNNTTHRSIRVSYSTWATLLLFAGFFLARFLTFLLALRLCYFFHFLSDDMNFLVCTHHAWSILWKRTLLANVKFSTIARHLLTMF